MWKSGGIKITIAQPNTTGHGLNIAFSDERSIKYSKIHNMYHCFLSKFWTVADDS